LTRRMRNSTRIFISNAEVPAEGKPPGSIVNVVQTGYVIGRSPLATAM